MNSYLNLQAKPRPLKLLDEPDGYISAMAKANLGHQMRCSVELLEKELTSEGAPRILQLQTDNDPADPSYWRLYANGALVASGTGAYARECFEREARAFLEGLRAAAEKQSALTQRDFRLLAVSRRVAAVKAGKIAERLATI